MKEGLHTEIGQSRPEKDRRQLAPAYPVLIKFSGSSVQELDLLLQLVFLIFCDDIQQVRIIQADLLLDPLFRPLQGIPESQDRASRSSLLIKVKMGMCLMAQTLKSLRVWASTPLPPSMTMTAESAAIRVR